MPRRPPVDFAAIARAALQRADDLVPRWLPQGKREGREWSALNPLRGDQHLGSFKVNLDTGQWSDFASEDSGGDLVSLYAYLHHGGAQAEAARELADELRIPVTPTATVVELKPKRPRSLWTPVVPVPDAAGPPPKAHTVRGFPEASWPYFDAGGRLLGVVYRFRTSDGGKEVLPCVWARHGGNGKEEWHWLQWAEPRPLYGLDRMAGRESLPVLVVEGEKCADAGHNLIGDHYLVLSWPGGGNATGKADWTPLAGRKVVIWPDCDAQRDKRTGELLPEAKQPGTRTAETIARILQAAGCEVGIVLVPSPGSVADGWDVADMIAEGAGADEVLARLANVRPPTADSGADPKSGDASAPASADVVDLEGKRPKRSGGPTPPEEDEVGWLLERRGEIVGCLANVAKILSRHKAWRGLIAWDEFACESVKLKPFPGVRRDKPGTWTGFDTSRATMWLTSRYMMTPAGTVVDEAVETVAKTRPFHRVREYLESLTWDGEPRTHEWLTKYLGVPMSEYSKRVARWYLTAMVARVMDPGCKFDYCLVLEGAQGMGKSSVFETLAGVDWFDDSELDIANKDSVLAIQGAWIHEFQEMGSLIRQEASRQKSFLTRRFDRIRPPFGRRIVKWPRQVVFGGTVNDWTWQKDPTGGRRFWPVEVSQLDLAGLREVRDQLFAEAVVAWRKGLRFWPSAEEQKKWFDPEQLRREAEDSYHDILYRWVDVYPGPSFAIDEAASDGLKIPIGQQTQSVNTRIGIILRKLGCSRSEKRNGVTRFLYHPPSWSQYGKALAQRRSEDEDDSPLPI